MQEEQCRRALMSAVSGVSIGSGCFFLALAINPPSWVVTKYPGLVAIDPATAIGVTLAGFALRLYNRDSLKETRSIVARVSRLAVAAIGLLMLAAHLASWFVRSPEIHLMTPGTALNMTLLGCSLVVFGSRRAHSVGQLLSFVALLLAMFSLLDNLLLPTEVFAPQMPNVTALLMSLLGVGVMLTHSGRGWLLAFTDGVPDVPRNRNTLVMVTLLAVVVAVYCLVVLQSTNRLPFATGQALRAPFAAAMIAAAVAWNGWLLSRLRKQWDRSRKLECSLEDSFDLLFQNLASPILIASLEGEVIRVNPFCQRLMRDSGAATGDLTLATLLDTPAATEAIRRSTLGAKPFVYPGERWRRNGLGAYGRIRVVMMWNDWKPRAYVLLPESVQEDAQDEAAGNWFAARHST